MPDDPNGDLPNGDPADGEPSKADLDAWIDELPKPVVDQLADVVVTSYGTDPSPPLVNPDEGWRGVGGSPWPRAGRGGAGSGASVGRAAVRRSSIRPGSADRL